MLSLVLLACNSSFDTADPSVSEDVEWNSSRPLSLLYQGQALPNASSLQLDTAPAGLRHPQVFTFYLSNHTQNAIILECEQSWENDDLYISECPSAIPSRGSAPLQITFSPESYASATTLFIPLVFSDLEYVLNLTLNIPSPLTTVFWGDKGYLLHSVDYAQTVEEYQPRTSSWAHSITWGNGLFLRTSSESHLWESDGIVEYSVDGRHWEQVLGSIDRAPSSCAFGNDRFVCTRADAISWVSEYHIYHEQSLGALEHHDIIFHNDQFIAVGRNGRRSVCEDGRQWSLDSFHGLGDDYVDIIATNTHLVAVGGQDRFLISWSADGISWDNHTFPPTLGAQLDSVVFDGQRTIISGHGTAGENILYTEDFQRWDPLRQDDPTLFMRIIGFLNDRYIGIGNQNNEQALYLSEDGQQWLLVHQFPSDVNIVGFATEGWGE